MRAEVEVHGNAESTCALEQLRKHPQRVHPSRGRALSLLGPPVQATSSGGCAQPLRLHHSAEATSTQDQMQGLAEL